MHSPSVPSIVYLAAVLFMAPTARAADCPTDAYTLWSDGIARGANIFQGRNPGGATNGFGDGDFTQTDFDELAAAGANYVQISHAGLFAETPPYALDPDAEANLDRVVGMARGAGMYAVIAFRSGPGRNENAISNRDGTVRETIWSNQGAHEAWVAMLRHAAERYGPDPTVIGFSVMVEPNAYARFGFPDPQFFYLDHSGTLEDVNRLHADAVAAIREVDPETPVLLEPDGFGNVVWLSYITPLADAHIVYTAHDYTPFDYSHQQQAGGNYPGTYDVDGQMVPVTQAFLATYLHRLQDYVDAHGVPVALTEFGVHRTAPNAAAYLADRIAIQDLLGSWAVWVWQPAGFIDPFSVHDPSAVHDVLTTAWARNCRRAGGGGGGVATIEGRARKLQRNGRAGKPIAQVMVSVGNLSQVTRKRRKKGAYLLTVPTGAQQVRATLPNRTCHVGAPAGPPALDIALTRDERRTIDVFCGR